MSFYSVFINSQYQLRSGWRILIYIILYILLTAPMIAFSQIVLHVLDVRGRILEAITIGLSAFGGWLAALILLKYLDKRPMQSLGLGMHPTAWRELIWGLLIGFGLLSMTVGLPWVLGWIEIKMNPELSAEYLMYGFFLNVLVFIMVAFNEEILFRGYIFQAFAEGTNRWIALIVLSSLFGLAHAGNPNASLFPIINIILAGVLLSLAYLQTRSLWMPVGIHLTWNFSEGYLYGLPVSGTSVYKPLTESRMLDMDWITGGSFGPEGGAACTIMCIFACAIVWYFFKPSQAMQTIITEAQHIQPFAPAVTAIPKSAEASVPPIPPSK